MKMNQNSAEENKIKCKVKAQKLSELIVQFHLKYNKLMIHLKKVT